MKNTFRQNAVPKILWAGNDPGLCDDIRQRMSGFGEIQKCDLQQFLRTIQEIRLDLLIIGNDVTHSQALFTLEELKSESANAHIPVMLLADSTFFELEYLHAGADHFLVCPIRPDILFARIKTILENQRRLKLHFRKQAGLPDEDIVVQDQDKLLLDNATRIVEMNLDNSAFNVQSLVYEMHMSQSVLYRRIKEITGCSVIEFIKTIRLMKAAQLLHQPHARVSEVAYMVGIEDPKNFRTSFQRKYCLSPSQYARMHRLQG
ncbi:hypothetical protein DSL64_24500 [Dyadobacter luteus]|uniref:HTH araC/xylS-type domain-containing protein n=1 Tax=Dyadobacter luteus TaxID=2259619 RepID=A0A3D8Y5B8_9BACT|nr:helix-turn-helix domain-containing protein [Dyadobacter luteus]REA57126.1 hypothetical protein DSL64_24500 [Dyadobacter luteus]